MHTLQLYLLRGQLDFLETRPQLVKQLANRAIFVGEKGEHKRHPLTFVCDCIDARKFSESKGLGFLGLLLEQGAKIDGFKVWFEDTPFLSAIGYYQTEIAHFLLDKGADYTHLGYHGASALHWAGWTGQDSLLSALLEFPIDFDLPDQDFGATPLLYSIHGYFRGGEKNKNNQLSCISKLLERGANPFHKDKEGNDAWAYLKDRDGQEILNILPSK